AREPETRRIFVYRELYAAGLRDEQQAEQIVSKSGEERLNLRILDPSMFNLRTEQQRPSIAAVYAAHGVLPVFPGFNNRKQGWAIVRRALAHDAGEAPRLQLLHGAAPHLARTMPTMVVDPLDPEDVADAIHGQKTEDHAPDALRYGLCAEAQPPRPETPMQIRFG